MKSKGTKECKICKADHSKFKPFDKEAFMKSAEAVAVSEDTSPDWMERFYKMDTNGWNISQGLNPNETRVLLDFIASELSKVEKKAYTRGREEVLREVLHEVRKDWDRAANKQDIWDLGNVEVILEKLKKKI